ncbi:MAG: GNAT family N-acetyltransferase [Verrucomicrobiae bacterium]|nr:GNAT family N-acetyltransferase [Verrucomicrobiae bacterium]MCX7721707.1 GNAT family N-acetyltransferase [Verrucomicrobiae bacterium]MDW7981042.1 GNAT family N-acetyltransferase [Verrucomicrobiales bacterium]
MNGESRPITYDPNWQEKYKSMIATADEAVKRIQPGQRIFIGTGAAEPLELVQALTRRAPELPDTEIVHLLTFGEAPYAHRELTQYFRVNSFFIAENVRGIIQEGLGDYTPIHLSDIPRLFDSGRLPLDVALIQVTPPDARGMCSLGVSVDIVKSATANAGLVIAQVNPNMPRTFGDSLVHVYDIDVLVPSTQPIIEVRPPEADDVTRQIAEHVAALIEDGSTLEFGIGRIPQALMGFLRDKKDLGIHTEMISDGIIELVEAGVVTGARKTLDRGKIVTSFCLGTKRLYDYVNNNPLFAFHPTEYVNDPAVITKQHKMVAINTALEIDLTGQVCSDSLGTKFFSGVGGQVDFNRGAAKAPGGKAIIALPSTAKGGTVSRIVTRLSPGAGVVVTRAGVHYVVTEYGVAYLHGKSIQERALALITIAHPKFRAQLLREAIEAKYLSASMADKEGKIMVGPKEFRATYLMPDGTQIVFRPIHPTDEPLMRELFYALSQQTIYYRFMSNIRVVPRRQIQDFVYIDHRNEVALVGTIPAAHGEDIIALGNYYLDPKTNRAEVAFVVHDKWQRKGIGTFLLQQLIRIARRNGIRGFTAEVLAENKGMQAVFAKSNCKISTRFDGRVYSYILDFE